MIRMRLGIAGSVVGLGLIAWTCAGQAQQGIAEKAGEKLDALGRGIKHGVASASEKVRGGFARVRTSVNDMEVESRIYSRLHWDKALNTASLELDVKGKGVVTLRGTVPDARARVKAVELAGETVGVTEVVDQLSVLPPVPTLDAPAQSPPRHVPEPL